MNVRVEEKMVCAIFQHSRDISEKQGKFIDVKLEPERIQELPEAKEWPAMGEFLVAINRTNLFRTTGCNSNNDPVEGGHSAPFVDIALDDPRLRHSDEACSKMLEKILALDGDDAAAGLVIELVQSEAKMPSGEVVPSTRLWFLGDKAQSELAFPIIAAALDAERVPDYLKHVCGELSLDDGPLVPRYIRLFLGKIDERVVGTYICDSHWGYNSDEIAIAVRLVGRIDEPQWRASITVGGDEAIYEGEVMDTPLSRDEAELLKVQGGESWPKTITLNVT